MRKILIVFLTFSFLIHVQTFAETKSGGARSFTPSDAIYPSPTEEDDIPVVTTPTEAVQEPICAPDDEPFGYYCKQGKLYGYVGESCRGDRDLGESCQVTTTLACPDGSDTYCAKGSLCNCNSKCVLPFSLPNNASCCADTVCKSGFCNKDTNTCQDENVIGSTEDQDEPPFNPFESSALLVGGALVGLVAIVFGKKIIFRA